MTVPASPAANQSMVRILVIAIGLMTLAIVVLFAAIVARLLNPREEESDRAADRVRIEQEIAERGTIDFSAAPVVEIGLPPGARVVETHVSADRATFVIETVQGERGVYTTPLDGYDFPVRMVFHSLE